MSRSERGALVTMGVDVINGTSSSDDTIVARAGPSALVKERNDACLEELDSFCRSSYGDRDIVDGVCVVVCTVRSGVVVVGLYQ